MRPSLSSEAFGRTLAGKRARFTRRKRLRTEREATCFEATSHRATGDHGRRSAPARSRRSTPTAPEGESRRRCGDGAGNRVSVNDSRGATEPGNRTTGPRTPGAGAGQPAEANGAASSSGNRCVTPRSNGGRATDRTGLRLRQRRSGNRPKGSGRQLPPGNRWEWSNGSGSGQPDDRPKTGIARRAFRGATGDVTGRAEG